MDPNTTSAIREIFVMLAAGLFAALCLTIIVLVIKLYRPIRDTVYNSAKITDNLRVITGNLAGVSEETAGNIAQVSRNAVSISENLKEGSEELPDTARIVGEAAKSVAETASTASKVADSVSRLASLGLTGGASSGVVSLLRLARTMLGGSRRSDDGGAHHGA